jgi:hypothetical protein
MFHWSIEFQGSCSTDLKLGQSVESMINWLSVNILLLHHQTCPQPVSQGLTSATPPKHRLRRDPVRVWSRDIPDFGI